MKEKTLSTQPYKGARDFYPEEMNTRNYIFNTWKKVCKSYGYEEYDGPFLESFDLYAAKSGAELVNEQLYSFEDRGDRKIVIRPEMTPTLARMVAGKYKTLPHPIKWFSIPNLWRYEKPQKGRLREHFQLNVDIFGVDGVEADFEILSIAVDIMKSIGATEKMFEIRVNNRRLMDDVYKELGIEKILEVNKAIDKKSKIGQESFDAVLKKDIGLTDEQIKDLNKFLKDSKNMLEKLKESSQGAQELTRLLELAKKYGKDKYIKYNPEIMRGLDYYTGNVFEQFNLNPDNNRAMFGGGRYDDLVEMFNGNKLSGVGFGMGDVTFKGFLEDWDLLPENKGNVEYFVTVWPGENGRFEKISYEIAEKLREEGKNTEVWLNSETKMDKQLKYADKKKVKYALIVGEKELEEDTITIKNMENGKQESKDLKDFFDEID